MDVGNERPPEPKLIECDRVESYAGYRGLETPRAVVVDGKRLEVVSVLSRRRILDRASGRTREVWRCGLADGRIATIELSEDGALRLFI
ncbi:MAG TPA: hypothetical protein VLJ16_09285 [Acidobacteriota bacterium]|nr:hypothetical protein [Acidobacteriota bacterium]